jgi:hypothetical protein
MCAAHRGLHVLAHQQPGPVAGDLGLAEPLEQRGDQRLHAEGAAGQRGGRAGEVQQPQQHGAVDRVPGEGVPELVADDEAQLLLVEQLDQAGGQHDHRTVHADRHRVHDRALLHEQLGRLLLVQDPAGVGEQAVEPRELLGRDLHRVAEQQQPHPALPDQPVEHLQQHVEAGELAQRGQRGAVRRVLVGAGADAGEGLAHAGRNGVLRFLRIVGHGRKPPRFCGGMVTRIRTYRPAALCAAGRAYSFPIDRDE